MNKLTLNQVIFLTEAYYILASDIHFRDNPKAQDIKQEIEQLVDILDAELKTHGLDPDHLSKFTWVDEEKDIMYFH